MPRSLTRCGAGGFGMLALARVERDDGVRALGLDELVVAEAVVAGVVNGGVDPDLQLVLEAGLEKAVETFERESEVAFGGLSDQDVDGQIVSAE